MGVFDETIKSANRFNRWQKKQSALSNKKVDVKAAKQMEENRVRYSGLKRMNVDPGVFLESVLEGNDLMPIGYFEMGKLAARPVGRIHFDLGPRIGQGYATGFLVAPNLLMTNQHVLPSANVAAAATVTFDAEDSFDGLPKIPHVFRLQPEALYISDKQLDFCFVAVRPISSQGTPLGEFGYLRLHRGTGKILREEYATIIQHPRGRQKHVAVRNNEIIVYVYDDELTESEAKENNHIYYSADTLPGSSGAPVLSDQWYVVALHRRGVPKTRKNAKGEAYAVRRDNKAANPSDPDEVIQFVANEGVRISRILKQLEVYAPQETPDGTAATQILKAIGRTLQVENAGPFWIPTSGNRTSLTSKVEINDDLFLELTRRSASVFHEAPGFDPNFLGVENGLPVLSEKLKKTAARRLDEADEYRLPFLHFTTVMHAQRRLPIYAAVNIDGKKINVSKKPNRPAWSYDPRIDEAHQPDDSIFSNMVQRGHMAAREFMWWGNDEEALKADIHSFTLTNVCPQMGKFNGSREWYKLERLLMAAAKSKKQRVNCFMGPVFSKDDPLYDDLRSDKSDAEFGTGIRMPLKFWYLLVWREVNELKHRGFLLDQGDDIDEAGELEFDFDAPETVVEVPIQKITKLTGLKFPGVD